MLKIATTSNKENLRFLFTFNPQNNCIHQLRLDVIIKDIHENALYPTPTSERSGIISQKHRSRELSFNYFQMKLAAGESNFSLFPHLHLPPRSSFIFPYFLCFIIIMLHKKEHLMEITDFLSIRVPLYSLIISYLNF